MVKVRNVYVAKAIVRESLLVIKQNPVNNKNGESSNEFTGNAAAEIQQVEENYKDYLV